MEYGFRIALYLNLEEKWSPTYDEEGTYTDKNGDTAYIPKGFQVSEENGKNTIDEGLVIRNATTDDRYVWIEVPKSVFTTAASRTDYEKIEEDLQAYTRAYKTDYEERKEERNGIRAGSISLRPDMRTRICFFRKRGIDQKKCSHSR